MSRADHRKNHYIYRITSPSGKYYIGMHSTDNLDDGYFGSGKLITASIKKHGKDKHTKEILEFLPSREALKLREKGLVNEELLGDKLCMNLRLGGEGFSGTEVRTWWGNPGYKARTSSAISAAMRNNNSTKGTNNKNLTRWVLKDPQGNILTQPQDQTGRAFIESLGLSYQMLIRFRSKNLPFSGGWTGWSVVSTTRPEGQKQKKSGARPSSHCSSRSKDVVPPNQECRW